MKYSISLLKRELKNTHPKELQRIIKLLERFIQEREAFKDCIHNRPAETKEQREVRAFDNDYSFRIGEISVLIFTSYEETPHHCLYSTQYTVCSESTTYKRILTIYEIIKDYCLSLNEDIKP